MWPLRGTQCPGLGTSPMDFWPAFSTLHVTGPHRSFFTLLGYVQYIFECLVNIRAK